MQRLLQGLLVMVVLIINIGCDQVSKRMVRANVDYQSEISLVSHYVTLTRVENKGAFLSLGSGLPPLIRMILLTVFPALALLAGFIFLVSRKELSWMVRIGTCFLLGGGLGNIYDRILYGSVTDFLHVDLGFFQTGIFNMADVSIMTGMAIVLTGAYLEARKNSQRISA